MKKPTEEAHGWGLLVGGPHPYLASYFKAYKAGIEITESYHRAVRVVLIPLAEWTRLKELEGKHASRE